MFLAISTFFFFYTVWMIVLAALQLEQIKFWKCKIQCKWKFELLTQNFFIIIVIALEMWRHICGI